MRCVCVCVTLDLQLGAVVCAGFRMLAKQEGVRHGYLMARDTDALHQKTSQPLIPTHYCLMENKTNIYAYQA